MNALTLPTTVADLVREHDEKFAAINAEIAAFEAAMTRLEMAATVQGTFADVVIRKRPYIHASDLRKNLRISGWKAVYNRLQIDSIASAKDKALFERTITDPPELTFENARATFGDYLERTRYHILRGLAEVFVGLDPAYKSHCNVKIGVAGLPKRAIVRYVGNHGSYGLNKIKDIINALAAYRGEPLAEHCELNAISGLHNIWGDIAGEAVLDGQHCPTDSKVHGIDRGVTIKKYKNGNAHVIFNKAALLDINRALAEFYGEVLPDVEDDDGDTKPRQSTTVAKDLQFYWTPRAVIEMALDKAGIYAPRNYDCNSATPDIYVLEPSCGDGRILDVLREYGCRTFGIEVHAGRAAEARAKGHSVQTANFLECPPEPKFDRVVMNPPFYGKHYLKHIRHALKFLKSGGALVSILPATAWYDHGIQQEFPDATWSDLPVASFSEAGTNVPTGIFKIIMRAAQ